MRDRSASDTTRHSYSVRPGLASHAWLSRTKRETYLMKLFYSGEYLP